MAKRVTPDTPSAGQGDVAKTSKRAEEEDANPLPKTPPELGELLWGDDPTADITVMVGERAFPVHSVVLCSRSSFFRGAIYTSGLRENRKQVVAPDGTRTISQPPIRLHDIDPATAAYVLQYLYTDDAGFLTIGNVEIIYEAARLYMMDDLLKACVRYLRSYRSLQFWPVLAIAQRLDNKELQHNCILNLGASMPTRFLLETPEFPTMMRLEDMVIFLGNDDMVVASELTIYELLVKWVAHDTDTRVPSLHTLLPLVRLCMIEVKALIPALDSLLALYRDGDPTLELLVNKLLKETFLWRLQQWPKGLLHEYPTIIKSRKSIPLSP